MSFVTPNRLGLGLCVVALLAGAGPAHAGLIKTAGTASTSNKGTVTTTAGQKQILATVDPYNIVKFNLNYTFEADKVDFVGVMGVNGYVLNTGSWFVSYDEGNPNLATIFDIRGYFPGYENAPEGGGEGGGETTFDLPILPPSPPGEVDMFALLFIDKRPDLEKQFTVFADGPSYMTGYDPETGEYTVINHTGIDPKTLIIPANAPDGTYGVGPNGVPLPPAVWMGLATGAGLLVSRLRSSRRAA